MDCDKCDLHDHHDIQDEKHVLFICPWEIIPFFFITSSKPIVCLSPLRSSGTRVRNGGAPLMPPRFLHLDLLRDPLIP